MTDTPRLGLALLVEGQASGEVTHNEALNLLDGLVHLAVADRDLSAPPGSPANGSCYIVSGTGSGDWLGHDEELALYYGGWLFVTPIEGMEVWVADEGTLIRYDGSRWLPVLDEGQWGGLWLGEDFDGTPPSTSTITMNRDLTDVIEVGDAVRFKLDSGAWRYAQVTAAASNLLTIAGAPLTTGAGDLTHLQVGRAWAHVDSIPILVGGTYGDDVDTDLLASDLGAHLVWEEGPAHLVGFRLRHGTADASSQPKVNAYVAGNPVGTENSNSGPAVSTSWVTCGVVAINTANYEIAHGDALTLGCTVAGGAGDAADLSAILIIVK